jgi:hypothetical protein
MPLQRSSFIMRQAKIMLYRFQARSMEEAQLVSAGLLQLEGCIDVLVSASCSVEAYFAVEGTESMRLVLPDGCRIVPTPNYWPGDLAILDWPFPRAAQGNQVRILHLCYIRGYGYRYVIVDQYTQASGWIDAQGLKPID